MSWSTLAAIVLSMVFVTAAPAWACTSPDDAACAAALAAGAGVCGLAPGAFAWLRPRASLVSTFGLVCGESWKVGAVNASLFLGYYVGSAAFGWYADTAGRRRCLIVSNLASAAAAAAAASAPGFWWFLAARVAQGAAVTGIPVSAYVLSTEAVGAAARGRAGTLSQMLYHVGEWLLPAAAVVLQDWRALNLAIAGWCLVTAGLAAGFCIESPRWLLLQGRQAEALAALGWLARLNARELPAGLELTYATFEQQQRPVAAPAAAAVQDAGAGGADQDRRSAAALAAAAAPGGDGDGDRAALLGGKPAPQLQRVAGATPQQSQGACSESVWLVCSRPLLARFFWASTMLCLSGATTFYIISLATDDLEGSLSFNFLATSAWELPVALAGAAAIDRAGRRSTISALLVLTAVGCFACAAVPPGAGARPGWGTAWASVGKAGCASAWTLAYCYAAELLPTTIRSAALSVVNQVSRLGGIIAPAVVFAGERAGRRRTVPFAVSGGAALAAAALLVGLPETLGRQQPDTVGELESMYNCDSAPPESPGPDRAPSVLRRLLSRASGGWQMLGAEDAGGGAGTELSAARGAA
ncbi:OCT4 [Scenedesmus sp. PABB004]|nr:OCT4 [Scenedesmus sp. PABB004]